MPTYFYVQKNTSYNYTTGRISFEVEIINIGNGMNLDRLQELSELLDLEDIFFPLPEGQALLVHINLTSM